MINWSGLGINYGDFGAYSAATTTTHFNYLYGLGFRRIRIILPTYATDNAYTNYFDMITKALATGFTKVEWGVTAGANFTGAQWDAYKTEVQRIAGLFQAINNPYLTLLLGNESEVNNNGAGAPNDATCITDTKTLATACQAIYTVGEIAYNASEGALSDWVTAGRGDIDKLGFNCYNTNAVFYTNVKTVIDTFGANGYISEWNANGGWGGGIHDESAYANEVSTKYDTLVKLNPSSAYFFTLQQNDAGFAFDIRNGADYHDAWYTITGGKTRGASVARGVSVVRGASIDRPSVRDFGVLGCLSFDGVNSYVTLADRPTDVIDNWAIGAWINPTAMPQLGTIISVGDTSNGYSLCIGNGGDASGLKLVALFSGVAWLTPEVYPTARVWQHVALVRRSGTSYFYLNGVPTTSGTNTPGVPTAGKGGIGARVPGATQPYHGLMDEAFVCEGGLTDAQILNIVRHSAYPTTGMKGLWKMDEGTGSLILDSSGNNNTGTISAAVFSSDVVMRSRLSIK